MRILFAITVFFPSRIYGGPATVALNQARELVRRGHEVTIVTSDVLTLVPTAHLSSSDAEIDGVHIKYFPTWILMRKFPALLSFTLLRWVKEHLRDFEVVHIHFARDWIPLAVARKSMRQGLRVFLQPHGMLGDTAGLRGIVDRLVVRRLLGQATGVLTLQETEQASVAAICPQAITVMVPNGACVAIDKEAWEVRALDKKIILFLARLHPRKRVMDIIEAIRILRNRDDSIRLRIVGPDEGDLHRAQQQVKEARLEQAVEFVGALPPAQVRGEFLNASVYALPSVDEPFPMTVLESMALGVPTIVTDGIHIRGLLERHRAAMIVAPTSEAIAEGIREMLANPAQARQFSQNGQRLIAKELTMEKVVDLLERVYQGVQVDAESNGSRPIIG